MYGDLAEWWPLLSAPEEYREEAGFAAEVLASASIPVHEVLELGSGGGNNAVHLRRRFTLTLVDLSEPMLEVSRRLNPDCEHHCADMRSVRLGRHYDAVFCHDALDYMATEDDLRAAVATAWAHCRPGGVAVFIPDATAETFRPGTDHGGHDDPSGRAARYLEWDWDPDPDDTSVLTDYTMVLREADGRVEVVHDRHHLGLFGQDVWLRLLRDVGFEAEVVLEDTEEDRPGRIVFVAHRPGA